MKELQEKLIELSKKLGNVDSAMKNIKEHIEFLKENKLDYFEWEEEFNSCKNTKMELEKKISVLTEAQNILLGI